MLASVHALRASTLEEMLSLIRQIPKRSPCALVVEFPRAYGRNTSTDPNDLIRVALVAGAIIERCQPIELHMPTPQEWKGQVPKNIHHMRIEKALSAAEHFVWTNYMARIKGAATRDANDSVGLGLHVLGRM